MDDNVKLQNAKTIWQEKLKLKGQLDKVSAKIINYWLKDDIINDHENYHHALSEYEAKRSYELGE